MNLFNQDDFKTAFDEANSISHPIEKEWHYPLFINHGWIPDTKHKMGFVRNYVYTHPKLDRQILYTVGYSKDYFRDGDLVLDWDELENYLNELSKL